MLGSKRMTEVDIVKSIGILLMIMGHIEFGVIFDFYIHAFHMPLFFIVAGFLYNDKKIGFGEYSLQKIRTLLVPYVCVGLFHYVIKLPYIIHANDDLLNPLIHLLYNNSDNLPIAGALWFLTALFFAYELMFLIRKIYSIGIQVVLTIAIVIAGYVLSKFLILPWSIGQALTCFGFVYIGWLVKVKYQKVLSCIYIDLLMVVIGFVVASFNSYINVRNAQYGNLIAFYAASLLIVFGIQGVIRQLLNYIPNGIISHIQYIGINSLVYMCFNQLIVWLPNKIFGHFSGFILFLLKIAELIIALLILKIVTLCLNNSWLWRLIVGRELNKK